MKKKKKKAVLGFGEEGRNRKRKEAAKYFNLISAIDFEMGK